MQIKYGFTEDMCSVQGRINVSGPWARYNYLGHRNTFLPSCWITPWKKFETANARTWVLRVFFVWTERPIISRATVLVK